MTSPGGLAYCLVPESTGPVPDGVRSEAVRSRLVQVCADCPADLMDAELRFWRLVLDGRWGTSDSPEFVAKAHEDGSPLQLLFQRLDDDRPRVEAHLDLGTDDLEADADRLVALGAERVAPGDGWIVLRDPAGLAFCTTGNDPRAVRVRGIG